MRGGQHALRVAGERDRRVEPLSEGGRLRAGVDRAAAQQQRRALGRGEQRRGALELAGRRRGRLAGLARGGRRGRAGLQAEHVDRHGEVRRPGPPGVQRGPRPPQRADGLRRFGRDLGETGDRGDQQRLVGNVVQRAPPGPERARSVVLARISSGTESWKASAIGVIALVTPGPVISTQTPGRPLTRA